VGDTLFFEILKTWSKQYGGQSAYSKDFITLAQKTVQQDLTHFFHQWLDAPIIPDILEYGLYKQNYQ